MAVDPDRMPAELVANIAVLAEAPHMLGPFVVVVVVVVDTAVAEDWQELDSDFLMVVPDILMVGPAFPRT